MMVYPEYISFYDWGASLFVDYPKENLPIPPHNVEQWEEWANVVSTTGVFQDASVPPPFTIENQTKVSSFQSWQDWAKVAYIAMINQPRIPKLKVI